MYIILVIFLVNTIISAQDSSSSDETRYIDLLQDKEKNEFLERIARRIFDEVQSKDDGDRASGELSDTQLDEHDAYVKKILAEESLNRRKSDDPENMNEKNHVKNESLDIKDVIQDNIGEAGLVNFTLREGKRSKRNNLEKSIEDSTIIHISSSDAGEKKNTNNENKLSNAQVVQEKDETDVEDIQIKYSRRNVAENTNEFEITSESSDLKRTQIIDFEAEVEKDKSVEFLADPKENVDKSPKDTEKSQKNIRNTTNSIENIGYNNSDENVEIINSGSTKAAYDSQEDKNPETEKNSHEKDFEKDSHEKNTHEKDFQEKDSHEKDSHGKDSDEKDEVTKDIINTTTSKPSSLLPLETVKPTKATTVKLSNKNVTTTEVQNIITHGRVLRSYTEAVTLDNNKTLFIKNDTKDNLVDGLDEGLSAVAVGNLNELKTNANLKKEDTEVITDAVHESEVTELQSDEGFSDKTTNTDIQENTTKKTIDIDSTTLKTEVLTVAALRNKGEANIDEEESYVKELTSGKEYTHKPNNNIGKSIEEKTNSNASVGANVNLTSYKNPHTNFERQGKIRELLNSTTNSRDDNSKEEKEGAKVNKNIYDLGNDIIKVLTSGKEYTHKPNNNIVSIEEKTNSNASVGDNINFTLYKINKNIYDLGNDIIKVIRTRPGFGSPEKNLNYLRPLYETMKAEEYKVYEVPEEKQPYLKKDYLNVANKENPYYVPIYNYSPDNAYYNPHNRLGPNADDENEHIIINTNVEDEKDDNSKDFEEMERVNDDRYTLSKDIKRLFRVYNNDIKENKNKFRFEKTKPKQNNNFEYKLNLPVVVKYPKFTDIILNPSDYLDMDYYYGRNLNAPSLRNHYETEKEVHNLFTDSSERDHSMNKMHEGNLKTSIKSIRQMMHRQKIFGFVPPTNFRSGDDSVFKSKSDEDTPTHTHSDYKIYKTIITDQVYGSKNDDTETRTHLKKKKTSHPNKARYIPKDKENIKEPYNNIFKNPTIVKNKNNYLNIIPYKGKNYLYNDIKLTTPAYIDVFTQYYNTPREDKNKKTTDFKTIKKISSDADKIDLVSTLEKLLKLNLTTTTKREENYVVVDIEPYVMVLEDMVRNSNRGLEQYNWLGTTVDIQAALMKLMQMIDAMQKRTYLSTPDAQLLKYFIYLHKSLKNGSENAMRKAVNMPRNKRKKKGIIKDSGLLNRTWLVRMLAEVTKYNQIVTEDDLQEFNEFLNDLQFYLYDLHTALQQITLITKYKSQRWFENLKELYLDTNRKNLLEVLLHMTTSRLLDLVEDSAKKGVEDDFLTYTMKNVKEVGRTKEELAFVLKVIEELKLLK